MNRKALCILLNAMSQPRTFYILGAGASYGLVPFTTQMRSSIENEFYQIGIYPTSPAPLSHLFDRVIGHGNIENDLSDLRHLLLRNIPHGALELLTQRSLYRSLSAIMPLQYAVFQLVGQPSTIFSYNLDGLASTYCGAKHCVIEPHGVIDRIWIESPDYENYLEYVAAYDGTLPYLSPKVLPSPELPGITGTKSFVYARKLFVRAPAVIIIGYSFAKWNGQYDDWESMEYFVELLRYSPKPIVILSPYPDELVDILQQRLSSFNIYGLRIRWESFSAALLKMIGVRIPIKSGLCGKQMDVLERIYYKECDKGQVS